MLTSKTIPEPHMIINFGSINIDRVYRVKTLPGPGETIAASTFEMHLGGKGINQSIAIARAGGLVRHVGAVGGDGDWVLSEITRLGVETAEIARLDGSTGHAIVMVDDGAENQIVIASGTNIRLTEEMVDQALKSSDPTSDWVLLQNETNLARYIVEQASGLGFKIAYSAAPFVAEVTLELLPRIDLLAVNEGEARALAAASGVADEDIPVPELLVTRGAAGSQMKVADKRFSQAAFAVEAVDTTGAGDTFLGSFLARYCEGVAPQQALQYAAAASSLQVTRPGAATAIPTRDEVAAFLTSRS